MHKRAVITFFCIDWKILPPSFLISFIDMTFSVILMDAWRWLRASSSNSLYASLAAFMKSAGERRDAFLTSVVAANSFWNCCQLVHFIFFVGRLWTTGSACRFQNRVLFIQPWYIMQNITSIQQGSDTNNHTTNTLIPVCDQFHTVDGSWLKSVHYA